MRVTAVGCSGSFPGPASPASCYLVQAEYGGRTWSIALDLGNGSLGIMQRFFDPRRLDAVLLTHLHPDHCLDLCGLHVMLTYQPTPNLDVPIPVFAPMGAAERMARAHGVVGPEPMDRWFRYVDLVHGRALQVGPFTVTPYRVNHPVEAYGFRVVEGGQVLAYTGDTDTCDMLTPLCTHASLVLADCAFVDGRDTVRDIHMSGSRAAQAALTAGGVRRLMLTHMPSWNDPRICHAQAADVWPGEVEICRPGATYEL